MKNLILMVMFLGLVSCGSGGSGGGSSSGGSNEPEVETFDRTYSYNTIISESLKKLVLTTVGDNTDAVVTFEDDSTKEYTLERVEEDTEDEVGYRLEDLCNESSEGSSGNFSVRLTNKSDNNDQMLFVGISWEGTCGSQQVSCVGLLEVDTFDENTQSVLEAYAISESADGGCGSIQTAVENLIENELE